MRIPTDKGLIMAKKKRIVKPEKKRQSKADKFVTQIKDAKANTSDWFIEREKAQANLDNIINNLRNALNRLAALEVKQAELKKERK